MSFKAKQAKPDFSSSGNDRACCARNDIFSASFKDSGGSNCVSCCSSSCGGS